VRRAANAPRSLLPRALAVAALIAVGRPAAAQTFDPRTQSPMVLLEGPTDGIAYYRAKQRGVDLLAQRNWVEAERVFAQLAAEYPRDGMNWLRLASARERLGKNAESISAYERAGERLGWGPWYLPRLNIASRKLAAGDRAGALAAIRTDLFEDHGILREWIYDNPDFAALRDDPEFRRLTNHVDTKGMSRDAGWRGDVRFVYEELARTSPDYRGRPLPAELTRRYEQLLADVPRLSDEEIFVRLNRMIAVLQAGHTSLFLPRGSRFLPFRPYAFPEGIHIVEADSAARALVGARIVAIGRMSIDSVLRLIALGRSVDGDMQHLWGAYNLTETYQLKGIGAIVRVDSVPVTVQTSDGTTRTVTLATRDSARPGRQDRLVAPPDVPPPMFLRDIAQNHWVVALPEHDATYVQFNNVLNDSDETLAAFGRRLGTMLDSSKRANLIIDVRHNNGGSTNLYVELLRSLVAFSRDSTHRVYALIGRRSYSATGNFVTDLERLVRPIWVGEATSECCNLHGDPAHVTLPYSRIEGEFSGVRWNLSQNVFDGRREMSPDVPVQLTAKAYFAGQDPALEAVFRLIASGRSATP
jgi:hypothetical protein